MSCNSYHSSRLSALEAILHELPTEDVPSFTVTATEDCDGDGGVACARHLNDSLDIAQSGDNPDPLPSVGIDTHRAPTLLGRMSALFTGSSRSFTRVLSFESD